MLDTLNNELSEKAVTRGASKTRRSYSKELKVTIVSECLAGARSVASIALEHGINANLIHKWIRLSREQPSSRMVPVAPPVVGELVTAGGGHIELSLSGATIRLYGDVEEARIRTVLRALQ